MIKNPILILLVILAAELSAIEISGNVNDIKFYYYPSPNDRREITHGNVGSLIRSNIQTGVSTVLIIDGFLSDGSSPMSQTLKNSFLSQNRRNQNVIIVDWGRLSGSGQPLGNIVQTIRSYLTVIRNVNPVAFRVAEFLNFLKYYKNIPFSNIHIVSHSLGAHIAGGAGGYIHTVFRGNLGRITGLDPAGPFFNIQTVDRKLNQGDAGFVDIYHTNRNALGSREHRTGDINVYINGGNGDQPGCRDSDGNGLITGFCSHSYSWKFFAATFYKDVRACPCLGFQCQCSSNCRTQCPNPIPIGIQASSRSLPGPLHVMVYDTFK